MLKRERIVASVAAALALFGQCAVAADPPKAADLHWIGGHWCSDDGKEHIEEHWLRRVRACCSE